jgi:hypothetical protein
MQEPLGSHLRRVHRRHRALYAAFAHACGTRTVALSPWRSRHRHAVPPHFVHRDSSRIARGEPILRSSPEAGVGKPFWQRACWRLQSQELAAVGIFLTSNLYAAVILNDLFFVLLQLVSAAWRITLT